MRRNAELGILMLVMFAALFLFDSAHNYSENAVFSNPLSGAVTYDTAGATRAGIAQGAQAVRCTDSDSGKNYGMKGTVKYNLDQAAAYQYEVTDSCSGSTLNEYYCDENGYAQTAYYTCPNGCSDGACKGSASESAVTTAPPAAATQPSNTGSALTAPATGEVWQFLADALNGMYYPDGKLTYAQYNDAYYALAAKQQLPSDVIAKIPAGSRETFEAQYNRGEISRSAYLAAYYYSLYKASAPATAVTTPSQGSDAAASGSGTPSAGTITTPGAGASAGSGSAVTQQPSGTPATSSAPEKCALDSSSKKLICPSGNPKREFAQSEKIDCLLSCQDNPLPASSGSAGSGSGSPVTFDLSQYPSPFVTSGGFDGFIVIGDQAGSSDPLAAVDIASSVGGQVKLASEIADVKAQNIISVGSACVNWVTAQLMNNPSNCAQGYVEGKSRIKLVQHSNGKVAIIVDGYSDMDTRRAARVLANYASWSGKLRGTEIEVRGTTFTDIQVGPPGSTSSGNANEGSGQSGPSGSQQQSQVCYLDSAIRKLICPSGNPKREYSESQKIDCLLECHATSSGQQGGSSGGSTTTPTVSGGPDLVIARVTSAPSIIYNGLASTFRVVIKNAGDRDSYDFRRNTEASSGIGTDSRVFATSLVFIGADGTRYFEGGADTVNLRAGQEQEVAMPLNQNNQPPVGTYRYQLTIDDGDRIREVNEDNNVYEGTSAVQVAEKPSNYGIDLFASVTGITDAGGAAVTEILPGNSYRFTVDVENIGLADVPAGSSFITILYLRSLQGNFVTISSKAFSHIEMSSKKSEWVVDWVAPQALAAGGYTIFARVDSQNVITEVNENNNDGPVRSISVRAKSGVNLAVASSAAVPGVGNVYTAQVSVKNTGESIAYIGDSTHSVGINFIVIDAKVEQNGQVKCQGLGYVRNSILPNAEVQVSPAIEMSNCVLVPGDYILDVLVDSHNVIAESNEDDNRARTHFSFGTGSGQVCPVTGTGGVVVGYRTGNGLYCGDSGQLLAQKIAGQSCINSFECQSNFCAAQKCVDQNLLQRLICTIVSC